MDEKKDITQEPEYKDLVNLLESMSEDRRALLIQTLEKMEREEASAQYYTTAQAAEKLGLTLAGVRLWLNNGKLLGKMFGGRWRVSKESVDKLLG